MSGLLAVVLSAGVVAAGCGGAPVSAAGPQQASNPVPAPPTAPTQPAGTVAGDHFVATGGFPLAGVYDAAHNRDFVTDRFLNEIDVVSPVSDSITGRIPIGRPTGMDWMPDKRTLLVATDSFMLATVDTEKLQIESRIPFDYDTGQLPETPRWVHVNADGTATVGTRLASADVPALGGPEGSQAAWGGGYFVRWSPVGAVQSLSLPVPAQQSGWAAASADGTTLMLTSDVTPTAAVVYDPLTGAVVPPDAMRDGPAVRNFLASALVNHDGSSLYTTNETGVYRFDHGLHTVATNEQQPLWSGDVPLALSPDEAKLYLPDGALSGQLDVLDAQTLEPLGSIAVPARPNYFLGQDGYGHFATSVPGGVVLLDLSGDPSAGAASAALKRAPRRAVGTGTHRAAVAADAATTVLATRTIPDSHTIQALLWDPMQQRLYAQEPGQVEVFSGDPLALSDTITLPEQPLWVAAMGLSPDGAQLYVVADYGLGSEPDPQLLVCDPTQAAPTATIDLMSLWPDRHVLAVTGVQGGRIAVLGYKYGPTDLMVVDPGGPDGTVYPTGLPAPTSGELARDPEGNQVLMAERVGADGEMQAFDVSSGQFSNVVQSPYEFVLPVSSPVMPNRFLMSGLGPVGVVAYGYADVNDSGGELTWSPVSSISGVTAQPDSGASSVIDPTGALLFAGDSYMQVLDIFEVQSARLLASFPADINLSTALDSANHRLFGATENGGITVVRFSTFPLSIGVVTPGTGTAGTVVTVSGNGFAADVAVTVDGMPVVADVQDPHTLTLTMPVHGAGPVQIRLSEPDGAWSAMDAAFAYR